VEAMKVEAMKVEAMKVEAMKVEAVTEIKEGQKSHFFYFSSV
jgi:hypothetical protein